MDDECFNIKSQCHWKLGILYRTQKYHSVETLITLYKSHILSFIEFRTPAIYHACNTILDEVGDIQKSCFRGIGVSEESSLIDYNLAPLWSRRDMAMLGVIHRTILGGGPPHTRKWFYLVDPKRCVTRHTANKHSKQIFDYRDGTHTEVLRRSILGLCRVYNNLPRCIVDSKTVSDFQRHLQKMMIEKLKLGDQNWSNIYSPRGELFQRWPR